MNKYLKKLLEIAKSKEFQKFVIIGGSAFVLDFTLLQIFLKIFNISDTDTLKETVANLFSSGISIVYNYIVQRRWAFQSKNTNIAKEAGKFAGVQLFNLITFQTILFSMVNYFLPVWFTKIFVTGVQLSASFILYKFFVFKKQTDTKVLEETIETGLN